MFLKDFYYLGKMWKNPRKPWKEIEKYQLKKVKSVVHHAYTNSPFYYKKFKKAGINPSDIKTLNDLSKIPVTTKEELRNAGDSVIAQNISPRQYRRITTSGSTGRKLTIIHSSDFVSHAHARFYRIYVDLGMRPFKTVSYIRYSPLDETILFDRIGDIFFQKLKLAPSYYISTFLDVDQQLELLLDQTPHILVGHPPDLVALAKKMCAAKRYITPDFIVSTSELLIEKEREFIEKTFACPVYNEYSSFEVSYIARDCKKKRMHILADSVLVEFLKDGEPATPGEEGEVFVTLLFEDATPFIRYKQGDIASYTDEPCDCGITFPLMNVIEGRTDDFVVLPSGEKIPPTRVVPIFFEFESVREFNVIQTALTTLVVNVVPTEYYTEKEEEELINLLKTELPGINITVKHVTTIEKTPAGKKRAVINKIT